MFITVSLSTAVQSYCVAPGRYVGLKGTAAQTEQQCRWLEQTAVRAYYACLCCCRLRNGLYEDETSHLESAGEAAVARVQQGGRVVRVPVGQLLSVSQTVSCCLVLLAWGRLNACAR
jgi:hypothetical protein